MKALIQIQNVSHAFGDRVLFEGVSLSLGERQKIGVLGRNGAGKSTLLKILAGELEPDSGEVLQLPDLKLAYLRQADDYKHLESVQAYLERSSGCESWEAARLAARFELGADILERPVGDLPGGLQMRTRLTGLLLKKPNLLLLDEPTNYLDLRTLLMLEKFLQQSKQSFLLVSHDREFLRRTCEQTLEVENGQCVFFPGNLDAFLEFRREDLERKQRFNQNIEARRKTVQEFIDRFRAKASKASQARSRKKELNRLQTIDMPGVGNSVKINLPKVSAQRGLAFSAENISLGYPDKTVAHGVDLQIARGSHVAVLGDNGEGKTTLLKSLAGELAVLQGEIKRPPTGKIAYYAQHVYHSLPKKGTVLDYLVSVAHADTARQSILDLAGALLFGGRDVERPLSILSGGERARVCLAGLILSRADILLLDEPTNHLDFETAEALGLALRSFKGTVILVSHDRTFVNLVATEILEVGGGSVRLYGGEYSSYVYSLQQRLQNTDENKSPDSDKKNTPEVESSHKSNSHKARKQVAADLRALHRDCKHLEQSLEALSSRRNILLEEMQSGDADAGTGMALENCLQELESIENEWILVQEKVASLESSLQN